MRSAGSTLTGHGEEPTPEQRALAERWIRRRQEPENEVPVPVALSPVVVRTDEVAVVLGGFHAHSTGFAFTLSVLLRHDPDHHQDVFSQVAGHAPSAEALLFGLELSDGRRAATAGRAASWAGPPRDDGDDGDDADELVLVSGGGGGGGRRYDQRYWVSPLPVSGPVRLVVRWDAQEVPETAVEVDGGAIAAAGAVAQELWPWEPGSDQPYEPPPLALPDDSWFSQP